MRFGGVRYPSHTVGTNIAIQSHSNNYQAKAANPTVLALRTLFRHLPHCSRIRTTVGYQNCTSPVTRYSGMWIVSEFPVIRKMFYEATWPTIRT
jgi:hypothetical protein